MPKIWRKYVSPKGSHTPYGYSLSYCRKQQRLSFVFSHKCDTKHTRICCLIGLWDSRCLLHAEFTKHKNTTGPYVCDFHIWQSCRKFALSMWDTRCTYSESSLCLTNTTTSHIVLTFSVRHLNAIKSTAGRSFLGIKPLPALQQM
jgi:hypothetical protein